MGSKRQWVSSMLGRLSKSKRRKTAEEFHTIRHTKHSKYLKHYVGQLPATPYAVHHLWCVPIDQKLASAIETKPIGGGTTPTHQIICVAFVQEKFRHVFSLTLALPQLFDEPFVPASQTSYNRVACNVTASLATRLKASKIPSFVLRCHSDKEFPWCMPPNVFDQFWEIEADVQTRYWLKH